MPIDINWLREDKGGDPEKWRESQRKRFQDPGLVDAVLALDAVRNRARPLRRSPSPARRCPPVPLALLSLF